MFTGIIEEIGKISEIKKTGKDNSLTISCTSIIKDMKLGDSIAVNGICLTVSRFDIMSFTADVMPITFQKSNLKNCRNGEFINLERALQLKSRLGGHLVSGHIDGIGKITSITKHENATRIKIQIDPEQRKYFIVEGSICIDGISLTIAELEQDHLTVSIIPETMRNTILQYKKSGDTVNIESDLLGKYLYNFLQYEGKVKSNISIQFLAEHGYV
ncbi:MAG: riboflavin synthase [Candidatus Cloacimonetes bacterium]|nr:riboflavin synthase [Candidatus Cloacimonadota bacterium]